MASGRVTQFSFERRRLSEVFREALAMKFVIVLVLIVGRAWPSASPCGVGDVTGMLERSGDRRRRWWRSAVASTTGLFGDVGLVAMREIRERVRGRIFRVGHAGHSPRRRRGHRHSRRSTHRARRRNGWASSGRVSPSLSHIIAVSGQRGRDARPDRHRARPSASQASNCKHGTARRGHRRRRSADPRRSEPAERRRTRRHRRSSRRWRPTWESSGPTRSPDSPAPRSSSWRTLGRWRSRTCRRRVRRERRRRRRRSGSSCCS